MERPRFLPPIPHQILDIQRKEFFKGKDENGKRKDGRVPEGKCVGATLAVARPRTVNNAFVGGDAPVRPVQYASMGCVGAGLSCPPSCQPIPGHCRGRQSGHFLEIASLFPPLAALRRFPRPRQPHGSPADFFTAAKERMTFPSCALFCDSQYFTLVRQMRIHSWS